MANKTIHELNQATTVTGSHEFAVYDTSNNSTQRASLAQIFDDNEILWADDEDEPISTDPVDFDSADELNPTDTENVTLLTGTDSWSQRFQKISQMFKNIRFILGKLGTTDISSIGNGTVTGALSELNNKYVIQPVESGTITLAVGGIQVVNIPAAKNGYRVAGIVAIYCRNSDAISINEFYHNRAESAANDSVTVLIKNDYSTGLSTTVRVHVLYQKA